MMEENKSISSNDSSPSPTHLEPSSSTSSFSHSTAATPSVQQTSSSGLHIVVKCKQLKLTPTTQTGKRRISLKLEPSDKTLHERHGTKALPSAPESSMATKLPYPFYSLQPTNITLPNHQDLDDIQPLHSPCTLFHQQFPCTPLANTTTTSILRAHELNECQPNQKETIELSSSTSHVNKGVILARHLPPFTDELNGSTTQPSEPLLILPNTSISFSELDVVSIPNPHLYRVSGEKCEPSVEIKNEFIQDILNPMEDSVNKSFSKPHLVPDLRHVDHHSHYVNSHDVSNSFLTPTLEDCVGDSWTLPSSSMPLEEPINNLDVVTTMTSTTSVHDDDDHTSSIKSKRYIGSTADKEFGHEKYSYHYKYLQGTDSRESFFPINIEDQEIMDNTNSLIDGSPDPNGNQLMNHHITNGYFDLYQEDESLDGKLLPCQRVQDEGENMSIKLIHSDVTNHQMIQHDLGGNSISSYSVDGYCDPSRGNQDISMEETQVSHPPIDDSNCHNDHDYTAHADSSIPLLSSPAIHLDGISTTTADSTLPQSVSPRLSEVEQIEKDRHYPRRPRGRISKRKFYSTTTRQVTLRPSTKQQISEVKPLSLSPTSQPSTISFPLAPKPRVRLNVILSQPKSPKSETAAVVVTPLVASDLLPDPMHLTPSPPSNSSSKRQNLTFRHNIKLFDGPESRHQSLEKLPKKVSKITLLNEDQQVKTLLPSSASHPNPSVKLLFSDDSTTESVVEPLQSSLLKKERVDDGEIKVENESVGGSKMTTRRSEKYKPSTMERIKMVPMSKMRTRRNSALYRTLNQETSDPLSLSTNKPCQLETKLSEPIRKGSQEHQLEINLGKEEIEPSSIGSKTLQNSPLSNANQSISSSYSAEQAHHNPLSSSHSGEYNIHQYSSSTSEPSCPLLMGHISPQQQYVLLEDMESSQILDQIQVQPSKTNQEANPILNQNPNSKQYPSSISNNPTIEQSLCNSSSPETYSFPSLANPDGFGMTPIISQSAGHTISSSSSSTDHHTHLYSPPSPPPPPLSSCYPNDYPHPLDAKTARIVVVGAGISGLASAQYLKQHGFAHVTILESRLRVGGRLHSVYLNDIALDLGASSFQGLEDNPIASLACQLGLRIYPTTSENFVIYDEDGNEIPSWIRDHAKSHFYQLIERMGGHPKYSEGTNSMAMSLEQAINLCTKSGEYIEPFVQLLKEYQMLDEETVEDNDDDGEKMNQDVQDISDDSDQRHLHVEKDKLLDSQNMANIHKSTGDELKEDLADDQFNNAKPLDSHDDLDPSPLAFNNIDLHRILSWYAADLEGKCAASSHNLNIQQWPFHMMNHDLFSDHNCLVVDGFAEIIRNLSLGLDIRLGCRVLDVHYENDPEIQRMDQVYVKYIDPHGSQRILGADAVLITLPLGVLKAQKVTFRPPLPKSKLQAISRLGFGVVNKIFLLFDQVFWNPDQEYFGLAGETQGKYYLFASLVRATGAPILVVYISGEAAIRIEGASQRQVVEEILHTLDKIFGQKKTNWIRGQPKKQQPLPADLNPHFEEKNEESKKKDEHDHACSSLPSILPQPIGVILTRWHSDPHCYGSHSYLAIHASNIAQMQDYKALAASIQHRIFFAGEHTHLTASGTVQGAYQSGIREAKHIMEKVCGLMIGESVMQVIHQGLEQEGPLPEMFVDLPWRPANYCSDFDHQIPRFEPQLDKISVELTQF